MAGNMLTGRPLALSRPRQFAAMLVVTVVASSLRIVEGRYSTSWHFFSDAAHWLLEPSRHGDAGGLDVFASHPEFQFGPLAVLVATPFAFIPGIGAAAAAAFSLFLGATCINRTDVVVRRLRPDVDPVRYGWALLVGGTTFLVVWTDIAVRTTHLDDALALTAAVGAMAAVTRDRGRQATLLLTV